jgi:hypothetical protein
MAEPTDNNEMIEIGDPSDETFVEEASPPIVIQYHERGGVPWMLIPPMLALSAVGSILIYHKLAPRRDAVPPVALAQPVELPGPKLVVNHDSNPVSRIVVTEEKRDELKPVEVVPEVPTTPPSSSLDAPAELKPPNEAIPPSAPPVAPRAPVQGLGFDPKALEADRNVEAPADPAFSPVAKDDRLEERDLPREVDPDLLPPDPREARRRQDQRKLDLARKVDEERVRFHAELKVICRKFREDSAAPIYEMRESYSLKVDPATEKQAAYLLGRNGKYAGADRRTRIELLRTLGYPEPVILDNLFVTYEKQQIGERDGPRDLEEAFYRSALFLLRNPPRLASPPARPVSNR